MHRDSRSAPLRSFGSLIESRTAALETDHGPFAAHFFRNLSTRRPALVLTRGDVASREPLLARVHSSCVTSESLGGCDCDCATQLDAALARIAEEGRGALFYLLQEGRGAGIAAKARDRMIVQSSDHQITTFEAYDLMGLGRDLRRYEEVAFACQLLRIAAPLRLLTNNPEKRAAVEAEGIEIAETVALRGGACAESAHYLASKSRTGHALDDPGDGAAELPAPLRYFDPHPLPELPELLRLAAYWLPVRALEQTAPQWFHLELFACPDGERLLLERSARDGEPVALRFERCELVDRLRRDGRERWRSAASALCRHGAAIAAFEPSRAEADAQASPDAWTLALLARAVGDRPARLLIDGAAPSDFDLACARALEAHGVRLEAPLALASA
jgi:3,4-dihydroxy 2-butanone 4-phosphate synthase / GTP cyclohydrolase II